MDLRGAKSNVMSLFETYRNGNCPLVALVASRPHSHPGPIRETLIIGLFILSRPQKLLHVSPFFVVTSRAGMERNLFCLPDVGKRCRRTKSHTALQFLLVSTFVQTPSSL